VKGTSAPGIRKTKGASLTLPKSFTDHSGRATLASYGIEQRSVQPALRDVFNGLAMPPKIATRVREMDYAFHRVLSVEGRDGGERSDETIGVTSRKIARQNRLCGRRPVECIKFRVENVAVLEHPCPPCWLGFATVSVGSGVIG
jgi:hypothetical protein